MQLVDQVVECIGSSAKELDEDMDYKTLVGVTNELYDIFDEEENQDSDDPGGGDGGALPDVNAQIVYPPKSL